MRDITFIRWGHLSPSKQLGYGSDSYHAPPCKKGLYAFPNEFIEPFLLGGFGFREDRHEWVKDEDGNLISNDKDSKVEKYATWNDKYEYWETNPGYMFHHKTKLPPHKQFEIGFEEINKYPEYLCKLKKPKIFKHYGEIWTHWVPKNTVEILSTNNSWCKVSYQSFVKLLQKRWAQERALKKSQGYGYSGDDCEVFIEKIISKKH